MPNRDTRRLIALQQDARLSLLRDYNVMIDKQIAGIKKRKRTGTARAYKQRVISDFRTALRTQQRNNIVEFKAQLFAKLNSIIKNPTRTADLMNSKDRFGYSLNYQLQRVNTRMIGKIGKIYDKSIVDGKLDRKSFYDQATSTVKENRMMQGLVDYNVARAYNQARFDRIVDTGTEFVTVRLSNRHTLHDICNDLAKTYPINEAPMPPFHLWCNCYVVAAQDRSGRSRADGEQTVDTRLHAREAEGDTAPVKPARRFNTNAEAEAYLDKRFPHMIVDLSGVDPELVNEIIDEIDQLSIQYPEVANQLEFFGTPLVKNVPRYNRYGQHVGYSTPSDILAELDPENIAAVAPNGKRFIINANYFGDHAKLRESLQNDAETGFAVSNDVRGVIRHEWGHLIQSEYDKIVGEYNNSKEKKLDDTFAQEFKNAYFNAYFSVKATADLSRYAMFNDDEKWAESFVAIHYRTKDSWTPSVQALDDLIRQYPLSTLRKKIGLGAFSGYAPRGK